MRWDFQGGNCRHRGRLKMMHGRVWAAHASQEWGGKGLGWFRKGQNNRFVAGTC